MGWRPQLSRPPATCSSATARLETSTATPGRLFSEDAEYHEDPSSRRWSDATPRAYLLEAPGQEQVESVERHWVLTDDLAAWHASSSGGPIGSGSPGS